MAWGSAKQVAFWKSQLKRYEPDALGRPCNGVDVFDLEAYKSKHVKRLKALRDKRRRKGWQKKEDARAKRRGFKDQADEIAQGYAGRKWTKKKHVSAGHESFHWSDRPRHDNPFRKD